MSERHATRADTLPDPDGPGGYWVVCCLTCGWEKEGRYARDGGEATALRLANLQGDLHETNTMLEARKRRG